MVALGKYLIVVLSAFFLDFLVIEMCPRHNHLSAGQITENFPFFPVVLRMKRWSRSSVGVQEI